jgi:serine phosphatase RsbU (regulator of sigma subunit)/HAMP domain-containing protein
MPFAPVEAPQQHHAMNSARGWHGLGSFDDLPIQFKASLASALLLICLLALGANAYLTSTRSAAGLRVLSSELVPKQQAFSDVSDAVVATHMKIFRYVSWASNGVSEKLLKPLEDEINAELDASSGLIAALTQRPGLSDEEKSALQQLVAKWQNCKAQARDTIDVARTDAPMATMMIGQTDDSFEAVDIDLRKTSQALVAKANALQNQLSSDAEQNQRVVVWVTLLGLLISVVVAVVIGRSIVRPIRSITDVMQRLSAGEIDVPIDQGTRRDEIGQMAQAIDVFRRNIIDKHAVEQTLAEAIEAITEGFSLYDAEDRLVVCNSHYREMFAYGPDTVMPGTRFEHIVGSAVGRGVIKEAGDGQAWLAERLERHRNPAGPHVQHRSDGRWVRVSERLTAAGGVVATYTDITELKSREAELDRAHAQVSALNETLRSDNRRMEGELDVTRRLQMMLLPTLEELRQVDGLEIACHMQAALEVGGDYYDVLQHQGRVKIGIGDVTGHGLESGVVMLMTQAIVRALLTSGETDHVRFLSVLNTALYGNVQRMGSDKNLTLCLLDYAAGELKISGQHEHVIVLRRDGAVEMVDTIDLGFPIGLAEEIAAFVGQAKVQLLPGDGVVLYTDGVTEAENMAREQYGLARLAAVLKAHWAGPAEAIKQAVVADLKRYIGAQNVYDDITLVVAKQT